MITTRSQTGMVLFGKEITKCIVDDKRHLRGFEKIELQPSIAIVNRILRNGNTANKPLTQEMAAKNVVIAIFRGKGNDRRAGNIKASAGKSGNRTRCGDHSRRIFRIEMLKRDGSNEVVGHEVDRCWRLDHDPITKGNRIEGNRD